MWSRWFEARQQAEVDARLAAERRLCVRASFERWAAIDLNPRVAADGRRLGRKDLRETGSSPSGELAAWVFPNFTGHGPAGVKDGGAFTRAQFERRIFPSLGDVAAEDVKRGDLLSLLDAVKAEGKLRTANVLLSDLKQMFRFSLTHDVVLRNPLDTVSKREVGGAPVERDRVLSVNELRQLARALPASGLQPRFAAGVWLILSTGVRVGELLGAVWSDSLASAADLLLLADASGVKLGHVDLDQRKW